MMLALPQLVHGLSKTTYPRSGEISAMPSRNLELLLRPPHLPKRRRVRADNKANARRAVFVWWGASSFLCTSMLYSMYITLYVVYFLYSETCHGGEEQGTDDMRRN